VTEESLAPDPATETAARIPGRWHGWADALVRSVGPIVLALITGGILLAVIGRDPVAFYNDVLKAGLFRASGLQDTITRTAPVLLVGAGLIVAFRAGLWNLGSDGQYLLAAAFVAGVAPGLLASVPVAVGWILLALLGMAVGAAWTIVPAWLRGRYGINEIITTLMMSFIGVGLASLLVKGPFDGPSTVPQTDVITPGGMLLNLPDVRIHIGVFLALFVSAAVYWLFARTAFGTRMDVLGANPRAAVHVGIDVPRLILVTFMLSGALIGLAAAVDIVGVFSYMRADWNPAYGLKVVPLVFLARLNALAMIPFAVFFGVMSIGGAYATRRADLPGDFLLVLMGLVLLFMVLTQYLSDRRARGEALLPRRSRMATAHA
jgi:general nucleoside transport system permease protein